MAARRTAAAAALADFRHETDKYIDDPTRAVPRPDYPMWAFRLASELLSVLQRLETEDAEAQPDSQLAEVRAVLEAFDWGGRRPPVRLGANRRDPEWAAVVNGDRLTRWTAVAAVLAVAAVAAWISYRHAVEVVTAHGEAGAVGHWYPVVIDGLIIAASMVLLDAARHRETAPRLAWWLLAAGIAATLAVNVLAGTAAGWLGALIASWPALAFVGCYELLMMLVRAAARRASAAVASIPRASAEPVTVAMPDLVPADVSVAVPPPVPVPGAVPAGVPGFAALNGHRAEAERLFAADIAAGTIPAIRRIRDAFHVGQPKAQAIQDYLKSRTSKVQE